jgi:hypothetical protein
MVKIQLETGYLDVKDGADFPLNFGVAEIRDLTKRSGTFSKSITLVHEHGYRWLCLFVTIHTYKPTTDKRI